MPKVLTKFIRKDHLFLDPENNEILETFHSISKAKKESRIRQLANGGLGLGYIKVIDTRDSKVIKPIPIVKTKIAARVLDRLSTPELGIIAAALNLRATISARDKKPSHGEF